MNSSPKSHIGQPSRWSSPRVSPWWPLTLALASGARGAEPIPAEPPPPWQIYANGFEADDGGFLVNQPGSWAWGAPLEGGTAHGGTKLWATGLADGYGPHEDSAAMSPVLDLSGRGAGATFQLRWWQQLETETQFDVAAVEASTDGGATWTTVYGPLSGPVSPAWTRRSVALGTQWAVPEFRFRFRLRTDGSSNARGFRVDDVEVVENQYQLNAAGLHSGGGLAQSTDHVVTLDGSLGGWVGGMGQTTGDSPVTLFPGLPALRDQGEAVPRILVLPLRLVAGRNSTGGEVTVQIFGVNPGRLYRLESTTDFPPAWRPVGEPIAPQPGAEVVTLTLTSPEAAAFYRLQMIPE